MSEENLYDIIICGGGITGLLLAKKITDDAYFKSHKIALIEKEDKNKKESFYCKIYCFFTIN